MSVHDGEKMDTSVPDDDENDPVTATYRVFLNPSLPAGRQLLVLQHPNRTDDTPRPPPSDFRLKSRSRMVEVDTPIDSTFGVYDREKGLKWGRNLKASMAAKSGGSHGLAGGFGVGAVQQRGARKKEAPEDDDALLDWREAVNQGKVLTTQTLGGQHPEAPEVQYMVGVFYEKDLHLTPVSSLIHLRPQLHHIDATTHLERQSSAKDGPASGSGAGASSAGAGGSARAIHMTIKNAGDGDRVTTETMADRLRAVQSEPWRKLQYTDEEDDSAWDVFDDSLYLKANPDAEIPEAEVKAKGKENEGTEKPGKEGEEKAEVDLETVVSKFGTRWGDDELLEAVSGLRKADLEPKPIVPVIKKETAPAAAAPQAAKKPESQPAAPPVPRAPGRTRGAAAAARRGRARAAAQPGPSSTVNID